MNTKIQFLDDYGETVVIIPVSLSHWDACLLANDMLSQGNIKAHDFHILEEEVT